MRKYSTFIIAIALAAFLPATMLNAAPFVWCIGGDGLAVIEVGNGAGWHGDDRHVPKIESSTSSKGGRHDKCVDSKLIGPAVSKASQDDVCSPVKTDPPNWFLAQQTAALDVPLPILLIRPPPHHHFEPPHLAALRTTILLI